MLEPGDASPDFVLLPCGIHEAPSPRATCPICAQAFVATVVDLLLAREEFLAVRHERWLPTVAPAERTYAAKRRDEGAPLLTVVAELAHRRAHPVEEAPKAVATVVTAARDPMLIAEAEASDRRKVRRTHIGYRKGAVLDEAAEIAIAKSFFSTLQHRPARVLAEEHQISVTRVYAISRRWGRSKVLLDWLDLETKTAKETPLAMNETKTRNAVLLIHLCDETGTYALTDRERRLALCGELHHPRINPQKFASNPQNVTCTRCLVEHRERSVASPSPAQPKNALQFIVDQEVVTAPASVAALAKEPEKELRLVDPADLADLAQLREENGHLRAELAERREEGIEAEERIKLLVENLRNLNDALVKATRPSPGMKADGGKPRFDLLPAAALEAVSRVLAFGASKYGEENWRGVESAPQRYRAAALRHLFAVQRGETTDPESGLPHLAHAACSLLFILELTAREDEG